MTYREDYKQKQLIGKPLHTKALLDLQLFLGRLNENIGALESQLTTVEKNLQARMEYWKKTRARTQALEKVMARFKLQESKKLDRRLQHEHDELATSKSGIDKF